MTAEITESVLLPNTLAVPPRLPSITALLVALLGGKGACRRPHPAAGTSSPCHAKLFFWTQRVEVVGFMPFFFFFFTLRGCWVPGRALGSHWRHRRESSRAAASNKIPAERIVPGA